MRLKVEIMDLTPSQWEQAQRVLQTEYDIPDGASRACLVLIHNGEERHVEIPVAKLTGFLTMLTLTPAFLAMGRLVDEAMRHVRTPFQVVQCSPECEAQDDDRPCLMNCPTRKRTDT